MITELIRIVRLEREKGTQADETAIRDAYEQISEIMEIPVEEVEEILDTGMWDYDKIKMRNRLLWVIGIAAAVAVLV